MAQNGNEQTRNEDLETERDSPGSTGNADGDAGRSPSAARKEKQPILRDALGERDVNFPQEDG